MHKEKKDEISEIHYYRKYFPHDSDYTKIHERSSNVRLFLDYIENI